MQVTNPGAAWMIAVPIWRGCERRRERGLRGQLMELLRNGIGYVAYVLSFQEGRESPQEGRWMRLPSGRQAENDGAAQGCSRAGPPEARTRIALLDSRCSGGPMAGAFVTRYDASS